MEREETSMNREQRKKEGRCKSREEGNGLREAEKRWSKEQWR